MLDFYWVRQFGRVNIQGNLQNDKTQKLQHAKGTVKNNTQKNQGVTKCSPKGR
jgi:hypothetical protein